MTDQLTFNIAEDAPFRCRQCVTHAALACLLWPSIPGMMVSIGSGSESFAAPMLWVGAWHVGRF